MHGFLDQKADWVQESSTRLNEIMFAGQQAGIIASLHEWAQARLSWKPVARATRPRKPSRSGGSRHRAWPSQYAAARRATAEELEQMQRDVDALVSTQRMIAWLDRNAMWAKKRKPSTIARRAGQDGIYVRVSRWEEAIRRWKRA